MTKPLVSVIMPTANRVHLLPLAIENFLKQDYPNKELIIITAYGEDIPFSFQYEELYSKSRKAVYYNPIDEDKNLITHLLERNNSIGAKRNAGIAESSGSIILHMDDDDFYSSDWITKSVNHLLTTGADMTGLSSAYFLKQPNQLWIYQYNKKLPPFKDFVLGATMSYLKSYWEKHKFKEYDPERPSQPLKTGEDWYFSLDCEKIIPHDYIDGFTAVIHGGNISSGKHLHNKAYSPVDISHLHNIMGADIEKYVTLQGKTS